MPHLRQTLHKKIPFARLREVKYGRVCVNYHPKKDDPNCMRLTVSGNKVNFPGDCGTPTVDMVTVKLYLNSVISTKGAHYCTIDLKDFYRMTPMTRPEYMHMKIKGLPKEFITMYNLADKATSDGYVYIKIQKGMYGLLQAGILAQELLKQRLNKHGYRQSPITPGLWRHNYWPISFTLCVDDFVMIQVRDNPNYARCLRYPGQTSEPSTSRCSIAAPSNHNY
jgi:hypothetical protein